MARDTRRHLNGTPVAYCGSMDRQLDGTYYYRASAIKRTEKGWEVWREPFRPFDGTYAPQRAGVLVAVKATRNAAGAFVDARVFNEEKKRAAARQAA